MCSTLAACPYEEEYNYNWHYAKVLTPITDLNINVKEDICATLEADNE